MTAEVSIDAGLNGSGPLQGNLLAAILRISFLC